LSLAAIADFVGSHILMRVLPIIALAAFASALSAALANPAAGAPATLTALPALAWVAAWTALAAYALETFGSLRDNVQTITTPAP
jgi:hypothetical protein